MRNTSSKLNPGKLITVIDRYTPWLGGVATLIWALGIYMALVSSPADYQQGESVRIMYIHVPSAWMSLFIYSVIALASSLYLIFRNPLYDLIARASAPVGAAFTLITLITGSLWGKPIWGAWWVWDARLTSELILFFIYISYISLSNSFSTRSNGALASAALALIGLLNIPIIKFSVNWWHTLHQPASIIRIDGPHIHISMLAPLLIMAIGSTIYFLLITVLRLKMLIISHKIIRLQIS